MPPSRCLVLGCEFYSQRRKGRPAAQRARALAGGCSAAEEAAEETRPRRRRSARARAGPVLNGPLDHPAVDRAAHFDDVLLEQRRGDPSLVPETAHGAWPPEKLRRVGRTASALFLEAHGFSGKTGGHARGPDGLLTTPFPMITLCAPSHEEQRSTRDVAAKKRAAEAALSASRRRSRSERRRKPGRSSAAGIHPPRWTARRSARARS
jgi:hypothetical protein